MNSLTEDVRQYRQQAREAEAKLERVREELTPALVAVLFAVVEDQFECWRERQALALRAAAEGREVDLPEPEIPHHADLAGELREQIRQATSIAGKPHAAGEDAQLLERAAAVARMPAGGSRVDRIGEVRSVLQGLHDRELAEKLKPVLEVLRQEERAARQGTGAAT